MAGSSAYSVLNDSEVLNRAIARNSRLRRFRFLALIVLVALWGVTLYTYVQLNRDLSEKHGLHAPVSFFRDAVVGNLRTQDLTFDEMVARLAVAHTYEEEREASVFRRTPILYSVIDKKNRRIVCELADGRRVEL